jgi:hypothetical protein
MKNKRLKIILATVIILLSIPLILMQFTNEVNWTLPDFVIAGLLLIGTGLLVEISLLKVKKINYRILTIIVIVIVFLLIWAELAVGIF